MLARPRSSLPAGGAGANSMHRRRSDPPRSKQQPLKQSPPLRVISVDRPKRMKRALDAAKEQPVDTTLERWRTRIFGRQATRSTRRRGREYRAFPASDAAGDEEDDAEFASNVVVSAKYTALNFFPRVLLAQVKRPSNIYFLFIAVLQAIKEVSNTNGVPTILLPLVFVFICSAIKEALEDRERHRADALMNSKSVLCMNAMGKWELRQWGDVQVGDIVKVLNDETVPADLFMLRAEELDDPGLDAEVVRKIKKENSGDALQKGRANYEQIDLSEKTGTDEPQPQPRSGGNLAYIETKSLDGETNLKIRTAIPVVATLSSLPYDLNALCGVIECEPPNNRIATFDGTFSVTLDKNQAAALGLQGAVDDGGRPTTAAVADSASTGHSLLQQLQKSPDGSLSVRVPITAKQMVLRSCVVRNTRAIIGIAIFTGHETKVFCSNTDPVVKTSSVEQRLNSLIIGVVFIQQLVCSLGALLGAYWMISQGNSYWYLHGSSKIGELELDPSRERLAFHHGGGHFPFQELIKLHVRYFIIMQNFVPISLNVSLEFVKYWQAYFIEQDLNMYDEVSDTPALVRSSALNEDLGRVHHIFTDKTGTLTMNLMLFRFCMIAGKHYGGEVRESDDTLESSSGTATQASSSQFVKFDPTELFADLRAGGEHADQIRLFLRHLALCHTLIPAKPFAEMCVSTSPQYSASSPDEQALVSAAAHCNVRFVHRTPNTLTILEPGLDESSVYKLLNLLEFDSDRKRMTVIVEDPGGEILLLCKGADNVILERLAADQTDDPAKVDEVYAQLSHYAKCGMRTLCLAYKKIDHAEYKMWNQRFVSAMSSMDELVKRRQGLPNAIDPLMNEIEADLTLLGVTAVQDKLQDGVPKTLQLLQQTNMKVWTLTGDKIETAINIGYACSLLTSDMEVMQVSSDEYVAVAKGLQEVAMRQEKILAMSAAAKSLESKPRRRMQLHAQTQPWDQRLKKSIEAFLFGAPSPSKKKRTRGRKAGRRDNSSHGIYSPVSTLDRDDGGSDGNDADDDADEGALLVRGGPLGGLGSASASSSVPTIALVIDGKSLENALRPRLRPLFYQVTKMCTSVICCRVSPKQKADIVEFVRYYEPESITLAIGDGANDVGMIQAAHVGVGISGQEGMQAVNSSDYAIGQFRFLQRLLFVHGRWAYRRVAKLMSYMLYKNVTYVLTTFWFGCFSGFSGQPLILDVAAQSFNVLYTSLPLVLFAVLDQDISSESAAKFPYLYSLGQKNVLLARRVFWPWILNGIWHSLIIFFISAWGFQGDLSVSTKHVNHPATVSSSGQEDGLVTLGFVVFTNLVIVVNLKLVLETFMVTWHFLTTIFASIALWFGIATLLSSPNSRFRHAAGEMTFLLQVPSFWALCVLVVTLSLMRDVLWKIVRRMNFPSTYHILQEREMLSMNNSPRSMLNEYKGIMWLDVQVPILDYAKMLRQIPPFESAQESFMRSSPLAESLISSSSSSSNELESSRHIRARASFHVTELHEDKYGVWEEEHHELHQLIEGSSSSSAAASGISNASQSMLSAGSSSISAPDPDSLRKQYHGYAFSEDENVDSDVEAASASKASEKYTGQSGGGGVPAIGGGRTFKKMLKSVRGPKNA